MNRLSAFALLILLLCAAGCASVPLESPEASAAAKEFAAPPADKAGLYVYRSTFVGQALKKDIWVDGECLGQSANGVFFYQEVPGNREHVIATESEFSPNELKITVQSGANYFIEQFIKLGVFVGGADLKIIDPETAQKVIAKLNMAKSGTCSRATP